MAEPILRQAGEVPLHSNATLVNANATPLNVNATPLSVNAIANQALCALVLSRRARRICAGGLSRWDNMSFVCFA